MVMEVAPLLWTKLIGLHRGYTWWRACNSNGPAETSELQIEVRSLFNVLTIVSRGIVQSISRLRPMGLRVHPSHPHDQLPCPQMTA